MKLKKTVSEQTRTRDQDKLEMTSKQTIIKQKTLLKKVDTSVKRNSFKQNTFKSMNIDVVKKRSISDFSST